jgi:hypothetical protein
MSDTSLAEVAALLRERNALDARLGQILGRPPEKGHLGEWIASQIFDIQLETSASHKAIDGRFRAGLLAGHTVNIKWFLKREGGLDMTESPDLDYYLVLTGPTTAALSSRGMTRPAVITAVYLFAAMQRASTTSRADPAGSSTCSASLGCTCNTSTKPPPGNHKTRSTYTDILTSSPVTSEPAHAATVRASSARMCPSRSP